jgi:hypothetical protein
MTQGSRTPDDVRINFAAEYLKTGSYRRSAEKVKIPERTGWDLARELDEDPEFTDRRRKLHARVLDRAEACVERSIELLADRLENAQETFAGPDGEVKVIDKSADYGKAIASLNDSLLRRAKIEFDARPKDTPQTSELKVIIQTTPVDDTPTDG